MNVLIVATTSYAGMGPYVSGIVNSFSPDDNVYFFFHDYEDEYFKSNISTELHGKSVFYSQPNTFVNKLREMVFNRLSYQKEILDSCRKWDIGVVHFINCCVNETMQRALARRHIKYVGTVHDLHPHEAKKEWYKMVRARISSRHNRSAIASTQNVITNSEVQIAELMKLYPGKNVFYHSFPSLVTKIVENGTIIPPEILNLEKPYILFFGRIEEYKGCHLLYKAFTGNHELQKNYHLVLAGKGMHAYPHDEKAENVIWINRYIKDEEISEIYKRAACVVYPYISATQSGVLSLAFYFGTPTLASDVPFFRSIIEPNAAGMLFAKSDVEDLSAKLMFILNADNTKMRLNEQSYYRNNYKDDAIREALLDIYSKL